MAAVLSQIPRAEVRFLGRPSVVLNGVIVPTEQLGRSKLLPVLALLTTHGSAGIRRDDIAHLLWPDETEQNAKANVRRHLHDINRRILCNGSAYLEHNGLLRWNPGIALTCDVLEFERSSTVGYQNIDAIELYTGDFLAGYEDEWIVAKREQLRCTLAERLRVACAEYQQSDPHLALNYAVRWLALDELDEEAARVVMELQAAIGQRTKACATFDALRRRLRDSIGVTPEQATLDTVSAIMRAGGDVTPNHDQRIVQLVGLLEEHRQVTIHGPAASGKSRLAASVADYAMALFSGNVFRVDASHANEDCPIALALAEIANAPSLLVVDNCEGRERDCQRVVETLAGNVRVLVTSRTVIAGQDVFTFEMELLRTHVTEQHHNIEGALAIDSVALFRQQAYLADRFFVVDPDNIQRIFELVRLSDGLPGVIVAAASRVRTRSLDEIILEMRRGDYLDWPMHRHGSRQVTSLREMIASWFRLLPSEQQARYHLLHAVQAYNAQLERMEAG